MRAWHHAPVHHLEEAGAYLITAGTYRKQHFFATPERLSMLQDRMWDLADEHRIAMQAWSIFSNHYHFVCISPKHPDAIRRMIARLHWVTAAAVNDLDGTPGRHVWHNYWDKHLTFQKSYLVRLKYVHYNPVKHGVSPAAESYQWCSAAWFERAATASFVRTVKSFRCDRVDVVDDYHPLDPWNAS